MEIERISEIVVSHGYPDSAIRKIEKGEKKEIEEEIKPVESLEGSSAGKGVGQDYDRYSWLGKIIRYSWLGKIIRYSWLGKEIDIFT